MPILHLPAPAVATARNREQWLSVAGWGMMAFLSVGFAVVSARYLSPAPVFPAPILKARAATHDPWLLLHILGGVIALATGPWQFSQRLRERFLGLHRWLGRIYLLVVAIGAIAGLRIALQSFGGLPTHVGFGMLATLWFFTAFMAYRRIRRGDVQSHREWMIRNFALTFAAVTLRIWLPLMTGPMHVPFLSAYVTISWLCWVPNLLAAEVLINTRR